MSASSFLAPLAAVFVFGSLTACATARPQLEPARVHVSTAEDIALAKVPNGTVIRRVLQMDRGKLVWTIDVAPAPGDTPDARRMTEVRVDAVTGNVEAVTKETAERPARPSAEKLATDSEP